MGIPPLPGAGVTVSRLAWIVLLLLTAVPTIALGQTHLVIVSGLSGDMAYGKRLHDWSITLANAARERMGLPDSQVVILTDAPERDPARIKARSSKEQVEGVLDDLAATAAADARIIIVLLGHGSYRQETSRFNLAGPDMTADDFARLLDAFATQHIVFVNTTSASGEFIEKLSGPRRVIITATKSGFERNQTLFGKYFVEAFEGDRADLDKDERVSALEAFQYARQAVARAYEQENRLLSEHAQLDDNGDGVGTAEPGGDVADGAVAMAVFFGQGASAPTSTTANGDPRLVGLYAEREALETRLAALRGEKARLDPAVYENRLEDLLLAIAQLSTRIRAIESGEPEP